MSKWSVEQVTKAIKGYYQIEGNGAGGNLHIVLDDFNIETDNIEWVKTWALEHDDLLGFALAEAMLELSFKDRIEALARVDPRFADSVRAEFKEDKLNVQSI